MNKSDFVIPLNGLSVGKTTFEWSFGKEFFDIFENTEILDARLDTVTVAEKSGHGVRMDCRISGYVSVACDRCMEPVRIPVDTSALLDLKFGAAEEKTAEDETGREIIRLGNDDTDFDLAQVIYDYVCLALPARRLHPEGECNADVLRYLESGIQVSAGKDEPAAENPFSALRNLFNS